MRRLWKDSFLGTLFIFFLIWLIYNVSALGIFNLFDPIGDALSDMQFTDVVFSRLRETPKADTNVVLVNIGDLNRRGLAQEINLISSYHPKAIGVDIRFPSYKPDTLGDLMLSEAIKNANENGNIVLGCKLVNYNEKTGNLDSVTYSIPIFSENATYNSYVNLVTDNAAAEQEKFKMTRNFSPRYYLKGDKNQEYLAFSVQLAKIYDPAKTEKFLKRNNNTEVINYRGDFRATGYDDKIAQQFFAIDVEDLFNENFVPSLLKDKIVLMGFMGSNFQSSAWEDKFYTPMNAKYAGKANPDMYGVVIHANIISMILYEDYVNVLPPWLEASLGIIIVFFNIMFFSVLYRKLSKWYDGLTKLLQLIELVILLFLIIMFFHWFTLKLNLTLAFAGITLAGDGLEVFYSVVMNLFSREGRTHIFAVEEK